MWPFNSKRLKSYLIGDKYKIILAFEHGGKKDFEFKNAYDMSTGRGLQALTIYEQFSMRCDRAYLEKHVKAVEILLNDPKSVKIGVLAEIHANLRDRLKLAPYPDHIYKVGRVIVLGGSDVPDAYEGARNQKKVGGGEAD